MHNDLVEKLIARRLRALADETREAPYGWAEFQRRRDTLAAAPRPVGRYRPAILAIVAAAAVLVMGFAIATLRHYRVSQLAPAGTVARSNVGTVALPVTQGLPAQPSLGVARPSTRALEGWLADLPHDPAVVRVGAHAAVSRLQDQIAALDDLMTAERAADAQPGRLDALEDQRAQLVSSLAQVRYAEMLASATL
jgi:hypothetical protein